MLFSFEGDDPKSSTIGRRTQRPRRDEDLDKFSQVKKTEMIKHKIGIGLIAPAVLGVA